ncbi:nitroreductase/quinone reductase family protein, partial [Nocardia cyriacigeorgica]|uniref:nitroreductase/quinone reductase family protein n=1 Tax=Nocardia cyriacigeorgica TaxID=135487 RepID=UPI0024573F05
MREGGRPPRPGGGAHESGENPPAAGWLIEAMWAVFDTTTLVDVQTDGFTSVYNLIFGSNAGGDRDPAWAHNLRANPKVVVEIAAANGLERYGAIAT